MTIARKLFARIARALGVSTDTRAAYVAPVTMQTVYVCHNPHDCVFWTRINGETIKTRSRVGMVAALASRGYVAANLA